MEIKVDYLSETREAKLSVRRIVKYGLPSKEPVETKRIIT